jgi:hypothetical protein
MREIILDNLHVIFLLAVWTVLTLMLFEETIFFTICLWIGFGIGCIARRPPQLTKRRNG